MQILSDQERDSLPGRFTAELNRIASDIVDQRIDEQENTLETLSDLQGGQDDYAAGMKPL